jgi:hypothetical protein
LYRDVGAYIRFHLHASADIPVQNALACRGAAAWPGDRTNDT